MLTAWDLQAVTGPRPTGLGYSVQLLLDAYRRYGGPDGGPADVAELRPNDRDAPLRGVPDRLGWEQWRLPLATARTLRYAAKSGQAPPALLYCPALGAPLHCALPRVAHVHDLIPLADPAQFRGAARWYWTKLLPDCWRRCAAITVSNASLVDEVEQRLGYPRERVHVVPYYASLPVAAASSSRSAARMPPPLGSLLGVRSNPYFLTLASHEPRKNLALPIRALATLAARGKRCDLICVGGETAHTAELKRLAAQLGVDGRIVWLGYQDREATLDLLRGAVALLFVSKLEGYGMPPQEAQALGAPVVLSDIACHRAVYDDAVRWELTDLAPEAQEGPPFVGVEDEATLAGILQRLLEDAAWRERLSATGLAYQNTFSPQETGAALRKAFESVLG